MFKNSSYAPLGAQLSWLPATVGAVYQHALWDFPGATERSASDAGDYEHAHITPNDHMLILPVTGLQY